jgi:hypothetical protein
MGDLNQQHNTRVQGENLQTQKNHETEVRNFYAKYEEDNPDFVTGWNDNSIQDYMKENPGLTPVAAHKLMKADKDTASAVETALNKERANIKAKRTARSIPGGPQGGAVVSQEKESADLTDTKEHGGLIGVLAARSRARTRAA